MRSGEVGRPAGTGEDPGMCPEATAAELDQVGPGIVAAEPQPSTDVSQQQVEGAPLLRPLEDPLELGGEVIDHDPVGEQVQRAQLLGPAEAVLDQHRHVVTGILVADVLEHGERHLVVERRARQLLVATLLDEPVDDVDRLLELLRSRPDRARCVHRFPRPHHTIERTALRRPPAVVVVTTAGRARPGPSADR
jgi:hypothetical protein